MTAIADPADAIRTLVSEASEYAGPTEGDDSDNASIWRAIDAAEEAIKVAPLVVAFVEGGLVQASQELPGVGVPEFVTLDFDREDSSDLDELRDFAGRVHETAAELAKRGEPMDPAWIADADKFLARAEDDIAEEAARAAKAKEETAAAFWALFPGIPRKAVIEALRDAEDDEGDIGSEAIRARAIRIAEDDDRERHERHVNLMKGCFLCEREAGAQTDRLTDPDEDIR